MAKTGRREDCTQGEDGREPLSTGAGCSRVQRIHTGCGGGDIASLLSRYSSNVDRHTAYCFPCRLLVDR